MDLPGFGRSEGRSDVFTPAAMGEFLLRFIAERGHSRSPSTTVCKHPSGLTAEMRRESVLPT